MSGAVAAHAAYNGAGTQGLAVTNKINDTGDIMSVFWTKHDTVRQLLHGSSIVEVVSSGSAGVTNAFGSSRIFTVNNDVDVLKDLYLEMTLAIKFTQASDAGATSTDPKARQLMDFELDQNFQYKIIDRVEYMVGTQIWHTLTGNDIKVMTRTSKAEGCAEILSKQIASDRFIVGDTDNTPLGADASSNTPIATGNSENVQVVVWIPALSADVGAPLRKFYNMTENGYLMAAAPQQSVKIKITFSSGTATGKFLEVSPASAVTTTTDVYPSPPTGFTLGTGVITAAGSVFDLPESNTVAADDAAGDYYPFRRVVLTHKNAGVSVTSAPTNPHTVELSIGRVRLFAKQIMLCKEERDQIRGVPNGLPYRVKMSQSIKADLPTGLEKTVDLDSLSLYASHLIISGDWAGADITFVELKLNSSSFSGSIPSLILKNDVAEGLGIYTGRTLMNPHVGRGIYMENLGRFERHHIIFPLAATAFSGSCVPFNRFDSIRLILKFSAVPENKTMDLTSMGITVTCVGETTILYKGGSATLAMY
jgi:hypothetical protein